MGTMHFDIPDFSFFEQGNIFSGSMSKLFNFKIWYGELFSVKVWYGENCFSATPESEIAASAEFEFTPQSIEEIDLWLKAKYESFCEAYNITPD